MSESVSQSVSQSVIQSNTVLIHSYTHGLTVVMHATIYNKLAVTWQVSKLVGSAMVSSNL